MKLLGIQTAMDIKGYIKSLTKYDNQLLPELEPQSTTRADTRSFIEPEAARLINSIILATKAKNVLELGTCVGYSGIWFAEALKITGGKLTTIDYDLDLLREAKVNFKRAGVTEHITIIEGELTEVIKKISDNSFDIVIQDARKSLYTELLGDCVRIVKPGGVIIADDTLYSREGTVEKLNEHLKKYNHTVFNDKRLYSSIIPVGEGVTISVKM
ncbi:MAG: O-methyltransferase [Pseudomonadota bacterium]